MEIRKEKREDVFDIAHIVTVEWNSTYRGIVSDSELQRLRETEEERAKKAYDEFDEKNNKCFVAVIDNKVVGFASYGVTDDPDFENTAELRALYVLDDYHGLGIGRKLVNATIEEFKKQGFNKMIICCLKGNPFNEFYKHIGGKYFKDGVYKRLNLPDNIYHFEI